MNETTQTLINARELIADPMRWQRSSLVGGTVARPCFCALGAIVAGSGVPIVLEDTHAGAGDEVIEFLHFDAQAMGTDDSYEYVARLDAVGVMASVISALGAPEDSFDLNLRNAWTNVVYTFNDRNDHAEVLEQFDKAIELSKEYYNAIEE